MTGYFITGFGAGIAVAIIFLAGKLYNYHKDVTNAKSVIERLERFNSDLQFKLKSVNP